METIRKKKMSVGGGHNSLMTGETLEGNVNRRHVRGKNKKDVLGLVNC